MSKRRLVKDWKNSKNYRQLATKLVYRVIFEDAFSNLTFDEEVKKSTLVANEVSRAAALYYGVLAKYKLLENIIAGFVDRPLDRLDSVIRVILIVASYELLYMHYPAYATINEFVALCKYNKYSSAASFVNAVLRKVEKNKTNIFNEIHSYSDDIRYSIDKSLLNDLVQYLGRENCLKFLENSFAHKHMAFRFRGSQEEKDLYLQKHGSAFSHSQLAREALILNENFSSINKTDLYKLLMPQGELAMFPAIILDPKEDDLLADFCAAPGNKSLQLQDLRMQKGRLFCYDLHINRTELIKKRFSLAKYTKERLENISVEARDMTKGIEKKFDKILLDVPCSSYGMLASKPELRYKYNKKNLMDLVSTQQLLLDNAARCLKIGGALVYSTCTLRYEENEGQVEAFLEKNKNFVLASFPDPRVDMTGLCDGFLRISPSRDCNEGFFISKLIKVSD